MLFTKKSLKKSLTATLAGVLATVSLGVTAPQAVAQERNLVAFGDSVLADPRADIYLGAKMSSTSPLGTNCPQSFNFAKRAGAKLGLPVRDFSCSGAVSMAPGPQMSTQVDEAIRTGALTGATSRVIYATGFNDTYNNRSLSMQDIRNRWVAYNAPIVNRIRAAAPNARIQIVGYPTIGSGDRYCLFHVNGGVLDATALPEVRSWEDKAQWMQVDLAAATRTEFLDLKPSTRNNGMCAGDNNRMWAGLIDFSGGPGNLPIHINARGHEHVANVVAAS